VTSQSRLDYIRLARISITIPAEIIPTGSRTGRAGHIPSMETGSQQRPELLWSPNAFGSWSTGAANRCLRTDLADADDS
jgi:hypothetical protein